MVRLIAGRAACTAHTRRCSPDVPTGRHQTDDPSSPDDIFRAKRSIERLNHSSPLPLPPQADNRHTIVLLQMTKSQNSRTFLDYEKVSLAMDGIFGMFEKRLKQMYPQMKTIDYDVSDLYNYIDALGDLSALVYDPHINAYAPQNKDWVKNKCFAHLKKQAGGR